MGICGSSRSAETMAEFQVCYWLWNKERTLGLRAECRDPGIDFAVVKMRVTSPLWNERQTLIRTGRSACATKGKETSGKECLCHKRKAKKQEENNMAV